MALLQYEGIKCPLIHKSIREGKVFKIYRCSDTIGARIEASDGNHLCASTNADSMLLLLQKIEWQLTTDKLQYRSPFRRSFGNSSLDFFIKNGGKIQISGNKYLGIKGILVDANDNIVASRYLTHLSNLLSSLEIDAIQYV